MFFKKTRKDITKILADLESYIDSHYVEESKEQEYAAPSPAFMAGRPLCPPAELRERPAAYQKRDNAPAAASPAAMPPRPVNFRKEPVCPKSRTVFQKKTKVAERSLEDVMAQLGETFQQRLFRLIDERGLTDVEVYKKANLDRKLFSKIRCNADYRPRKTTAAALAVALELNLDETKDLLSRAELALSPCSKFDLILSFFIEQEIYDIYTINEALFQHGQSILGT